MTVGLRSEDGKEPLRLGNSQIRFRTRILGAFLLWEKKTLGEGRKKPLFVDSCCLLNHGQRFTLLPLRKPWFILRTLSSRMCRGQTKLLSGPVRDMSTPVLEVIMVSNKKEGASSSVSNMVCRIGQVGTTFQKFQALRSIAE